MLGGAGAVLEETFVPNATVALVLGRAAVLTEANNARDWAHAPPEDISRSDGLVTEVDGLQLHLSATSSTGYRGVVDRSQQGKKRDRPFEAQATAPVDPTKEQQQSIAAIVNGSTTPLGPELLANPLGGAVTKLLARTEREEYLAMNKQATEGKEINDVMLREEMHKEQALGGPIKDELPLGSFRRALFYWNSFWYFPVLITMILVPMPRNPLYPF